jgi:tRNA A37 threonylcarbamoyladenosine modification protein TsaB
MNFLVIDGTSDKINFFSYYNNNSYNKSLEVNKNNNEKIALLLFDFFDENKIILKNLNSIFVNQGPGKFSLIRTSISIAKALSVTNELDLYTFNKKDLKSGEYMNILDLYNSGKLTKNLIIPVYSS